MMQDLSHSIMPLLFVLFWLLVIAGGVISITVFLIIAWRWMRAHEKVAQSLKNLVDVLQQNDQNT